MVSEKSQHLPPPGVVVVPPPPDAPPAPPTDWSVAGELLSIPVAGPRGRAWHLDGFYRAAPARKKGRSAAAPPLIAFVHGMGSNFYRSKLKKAFLDAASAAGFPILAFNNSGAEGGTASERFTDCLYDLDAVRAWARRRMHGSIVWVGHSTGCQKATYWESRRRTAAAPASAAIVLLAPADDNAILARDLGQGGLARKIAWARREIAAGCPDSMFERAYERFTARRFLSVADAASTEASIFRYAGPLAAFRRLRCPVLAVFGDAEEFAALPPAAMLDKLAAATRSPRFDSWLVPGAGHSFRGAEAPLAAAVCRWVKALAPAKP